MGKNISRRDFLKTAGLATASLCLPKFLKAENQKKPNVIVMYIDDLNFSQLGYLGADVLTPNIDKLAREGTVFNRYYATSPVCTPSRYSALTGRYAGKCDKLKEDFPLDDPALIRWNTFLTESENTIAHHLKSTDYTTGMVGKYHLFPNISVQKENPEDPDLSDPQVKKNLEYNYRKTQEHAKNVAGFDYAESLYANNVQFLELPQELQHHNQDWVTKGALDFIDKNKDNPFFLYFSTTIPHEPPPVESMKQDSRITPWGYLEEKPDVQPSRESVFRRVEEAGYDISTATMTWLDDAVGALVDKLEKEDLREDTMIIFASDHGSQKGKMTLYEGGANCPAFINWKNNIPENKEEDRLTANIDIVPTVLDACNVTPNQNIDIDGRSWLPLVKNNISDWRKSLYLEVTYTRGVVTEDWKYIAVRFPEEVQKKINENNKSEFNQEGKTFSPNNPKGKKKARYNAHNDYPYYFDRDQMYYLKEDPYEHINTARSYNYQEKLQKFKNLLKKHSKDIPHDFGEF